MDIFHKTDVLAQGRSGQHGLVDRGDLVRQRLDAGRMDGQKRVEEMGEPDTVRLGDQPEQGSIAIETPGTSTLQNLKTGFILSEEKLLCPSPLRGPVGQGQRLAAVPVHGNDRHR